MGKALVVKIDQKYQLAEQNSAKTCVGKKESMKNFGDYKISRQGYNFTQYLPKPVLRVRKVIK